MLRNHVDVARRHTVDLLEPQRAVQRLALGITAPREAPEAVSPVAPLEAVRQAIVAYSMQIVAMQSDDPSRLPAARKTLAPIDEFRAAQARRLAASNGASEAEDDAVDVTPDTPVPAIDDEPASTA